jgi:hypothetical protein
MTSLEVGRIYEIDYNKIDPNPAGVPKPIAVKHIYPLKSYRIKYIEILRAGEPMYGNVLYTIQTLDDNFKEVGQATSMDSSWGIPIVRDVGNASELRTRARTAKLRPEIEHSYWGDAAKVLQNEVSPDVKKLIGARRRRTQMHLRHRTRGAKRNRKTRKHRR